MAAVDGGQQRVVRGRGPARFGTKSKIWDDSDSDDEPSPVVEVEEPRKPDAGREDRLVAALLLRDARWKAARAQEEGLSALLADEAAGPAKVNPRLLKGEISQVRSHNRRCGIEPLPEEQRPPDAAQRGGDAATLELEFKQAAQQIREAAPAASGASAAAAVPASGGGGGGGAAASAPPRKRQRLGAAGTMLDIEAAQAAEAELAEADATLANPLLRRKLVVLRTRRALAVATDGAADPAPAADAAGGGGAATEPVAAAKAEEAEPAGADGSWEDLWPSKGLRVRIVDVGGRFAASHLKKGVVVRRNSQLRAVDIRIDGGEEVVTGVPQARLETVVSKTCKRVEVVRGEHRGVTAELLSRDARGNVAVIRLPHGKLQDAQIELPLDDVCEFV